MPNNPYCRGRHQYTYPKQQAGASRDSPQPQSKVTTAVTRTPKRKQRGRTGHPRKDPTFAKRWRMWATLFC
jgi:hypothetical protein